MKNMAYGLNDTPFLEGRSTYMAGFGGKMFE